MAQQLKKSYAYLIWFFCGKLSTERQTIFKEEEV